MPNDTQVPDVPRLKRMFESIAHCRALGMAVDDVGSGSALMSLPYRDDLVGNAENGHLHGGAVTSLLDTAGGLATLAEVGTTGAIATLDLRIDYLKPATPGETVRAFAECYKATHFVVFVRGMAYHNDRDDPIATCVATYMRKGAYERDERGRGEDGRGKDGP
jgi:uncharacterized protein (TIGR00369 family)